MWFQKHTVAGRVPALDASYRRHADAVVRPGTEVEFHTLPAATYDADLPEGLVRSWAAESLFASYFAARAIAAQRAGADVYVIGTSQDPGFVEAAAFADIPVVAYGATAAHVASLITRRFAFVGFIPELEEPIRDNMARYGFADRLAPFAYIQSGPPAIAAAFAGDTEPFMDAFRSAAEQSIKGGAEAIIPGEGLPNEILYHAGVRDIDGVPILDANGLLMKFAEFMVDVRAAGLAVKPRRGYYNTAPPASDLQHLLDLFGPRTFELPER